MDILDVLQKDHQQIRNLVHRVTKATNHATWSRRAHDLIVAMIAHHVSEEKTVFNLLDDMADINNHRATETREHNSILNQLYALEETSNESNHEDTLSSFGRISDQIENHFIHEETILFPLFKIAFSASKSKKIGKRIIEINTEYLAHAV